MKTSQLVISVVGEDRPGIVSELCRVATDAGCNVENSRMTALGSEFAIIMLLSGSWDALAKFENQIPLLEKKQLTVLCKRTEPISEKKQMIHYNINVVSMDHPGLVYDISDFFAARGIDIEDLSTSSYRASHTGAPMFTLDMIIELGPQIKIAELREQFAILCDELNVDAAMEPVK